MDIMELGAIGELVGGVAVLVTLMYLALQVRQSSRLSKATMGFEIMREFNHMHETALGNTEILSVLMKVESREVLTPLDERIFRAYGTRLVNTWVGLNMAHKENVLSSFMMNQMQSEVVTSCEQYPPLRAIINGMFENLPDMRDLKIFERYRYKQGPQAKPWTSPTSPASKSSSMASERGRDATRLGDGPGDGPGYPRRPLSLRSRLGCRDGRVPQRLRA